MTLEDTHTDTDILEVMQEEALKAPEPGETRIGQDISGTIKDGDEEAHIPAVISSIQSAGYTYLFNTRTGDRSKFNNNMLPRVLVQKWKDDPLMGRLVWNKTEPLNPPNPIRPGTLKCMLHQDAPNRSRYDVMGFPVCSKDNLASPYQVTRHMQKKHSDEWKNMEHERIERERQEDRKAQKNLTKALSSRK